MRAERGSRTSSTTHGHNAIRPFFVLSEPVYNSELGQWLIRLMNLMPYDDWNIVYLPMDRETQAAMGGLPLILASRSVPSTN